MLLKTYSATHFMLFLHTKIANLKSNSLALFFARCYRKFLPFKTSCLTGLGSILGMSWWGCSLEKYSVYIAVSVAISLGTSLKGNVFLEGASEC